MSDEQEDDGRVYDATPKKLEDARRKGDVPQSQDLSVAASYGGFLLVAAAGGAWSLTAMGGALAAFLERPEALARAVFDGGGAPVAQGVAGALAGPLTVWFAGPAAAVLAGLIAQRSFVVAPSKLAPKANRISPLSNAKQKFGRTGLFTFAKSFVKLVVYGTALGLFLVGRLDGMIAAARGGPEAAVVQLLTASVGFLSIVLVISVAVAAVDVLWQRADFARRMRMTLKELRDEMKESEGDPALKQKRRQRAIDIAGNRMLQDVPDADVVVMNPTHFAVALRWDRGSGRAPVCVAKGVDELALKIREVAIEAGVPVRQDPPTARALYAAVEVGDEVARDLYRPVAAAIRFAEAMRKRARERGW